MNQMGEDRKQLARVIRQSRSDKWLDNYIGALNVITYIRMQRRMQMIMTKLISEL